MKEIPLTQGKTALVSDEDYQRVSAFSWYALRARNTWYAVRTEYCPRRRCVYLHRFLMGEPKGCDVDHDNGDGLDNQRHNLRTATRSQHRTVSPFPVQGKTSRFRGVCWHKGHSRWVAKVSVNKHQVILGEFDDEERAARAFDAAAAEHYGSWAQFNFSKEQANHGSK